MKWYVGVKNGNKMEAFTSDKTPFETIYGPRYYAVIGPFKTKRAAKWAEVYGPGNPHFNHVNDAERIAKLK